MNNTQWTLIDRLDMCTETLLTLCIYLSYCCWIIIARGLGCSEIGEGGWDVGGRRRKMYKFLHHSIFVNVPGSWNAKKIGKVFFHYIICSKNVPGVLKRQKKGRRDFGALGWRWIGKRYTSSFDHDPWLAKILEWSALAFKSCRPETLTAEEK